MSKLPVNSGVIDSILELFAIVGMNKVGIIKIIDKKGIIVLEKLFKDIKTSKNKK